MDERIPTILRLCRGTRILDIGCAGGGGPPSDLRLEKYYLHKHLVENFPEVVGVGISGGNVKVMVEMGYQNIFVMNAEHLDPNNREV